MLRRFHLLVPVLLLALSACGGAPPSDVAADGESGVVDRGEAGQAGDDGATRDGPTVVVIGQDGAAAEGSLDGTAPDAPAVQDGGAALDATADAGGDAAAPGTPDAAIVEASVVEASTGVDAAVEAGCPAGQLTCGGACVADDVHDCGSCGHDCTNLAHVSGPTSCTAGGACSVPASSCAPGWADCDGDPDDGCETDVTQASHCGGCGNACPSSLPVCAATGGAYTCTSGCPATAPTLCGATCADTAGDPANCGACGHACPAAAHAQPVCVASACGTQCDTGYTACGGDCVDVTSDEANCGACGKACGSGQVCSGGTCTCTAASCPQGCCGADGACVAWASETASACGTGGAACAACGASEVCTGQGSCACAPGLSACSGACVDVTTDNADCGACGNVCAAGQVCSGGQCTCTPSSCPQGCCSASGACVPWAAESPADCGTAGAACGACPSQEACSGQGACECLGTMCGSSCIWTAIDPNNCGSCGHSCLGGSCSNGECQAITLATTGGLDIAVDATNVYWSDGTSFYSCPLAGGCGAGKVLDAAINSTTPALTTIAVPPAGTYGAEVFLATGNWSSTLSGGLYGVPRTGGTPTAIFSGQYPFSAVAFDPGSGLLYYVQQFPGAPQTAGVYSVPPAGGTAATLVNMGSDTLGPIAVGGGNVYVADTAQGLITKCWGTPSVCENVASGLPATALFFDGTDLWATGYQDSAGFVYRCPGGDSCKSLLGIGDKLGGIASDGTNVYVADEGSLGVLRCSVGGCTGSLSFGYVAPGATAVAVDSVAVYWVDSTGVRKVAK